MNRGRRAAQRGSALVLGAALLGVALACLMVLDVAHVFTVKRELQKVADLAALAGARLPGDCAAMQGRAGASATANGHATGADNTSDFACGAWTPESGFAAATDPSALRATVTRHVPYFFLVGARAVQAEATARNEAYDVFSLGTGLASLHAGALNALLKALTGSQVDLDLLSYQGLARGKVRLLDLVGTDVLDVGSVQELLAADLRASDFVLAMARAVGRDDTVTASVLEALSLKVPTGLRVRLRDIVDVQLPSVEAGGQARLNALELLLASLQLANGSNLLDLSASVPPNPLATASLKLRVVEPPRIAIGTEGVQARSAQLRLLLDLRLGSLALPAGLASVTALHVPLYIEAAPGVATLRAMACETDPADCAVDIDVQGGLARACIGSDALNGPASATGCANPAPLMGAQVTAFGLLIANVSVEGKAVADLASPTVRPVRFGRGGFAGSSVTDSLWQGGSSASGSVSQLLKSLFTDLQLTPRLDMVGVDLGGVLGGLLSLLLRAVDAAVETAATTVLQPVLQGLLDPLLAVLGVRVGTTDLHQIELHCGHAELVR